MASVLYHQPPPPGTHGVGEGGRPGRSKQGSGSLSQPGPVHSQVTESQQVTKFPATSSLWVTDRQGMQPLRPGPVHTVRGILARLARLPGYLLGRRSAALVENTTGELPDCGLRGCVCERSPSQRQHRWLVGVLSRGRYVTLRFILYGAGLGMGRTSQRGQGNATVLLLFLPACLGSPPVRDGMCTMSTVR
jgi:hypothetical protein